MRRCDFCRLFERSWHAYWFSAVIVSGRRDLPSDARTFIAAKKAHQSSARRRHVQDQKTCLQAIYKFKSNRVLRADQKKGSNLSTVSVLANGGLHQDLKHRGCYGTTPGERRSQMFVYKLSPFPFPPPSLSSRFFHPIPKQRAFSQATLRCMDRVLRLRNRQGSKAHVFRHDRRGFKRFINRT